MHNDYESFSEVFAYDPETGRIRNKRKRNGRYSEFADNHRKDGYRRVKHRGAYWRAHRVAWLLYYGEWPKQWIDHINRVRDDNRIVNLRDAPPSVNRINRGPPEPHVPVVPSNMEPF